MQTRGQCEQCVSLERHLELHVPHSCSVHLFAIISANPAVLELITNLYVKVSLTAADTVKEVPELLGGGCAVLAATEMLLAKWRCSKGGVCFVSLAVLKNLQQRGCALS